MIQNKYLIEVCAASVDSAIAAQQGGAKRIELCDNLYEGGTTPSFATIKSARINLQIGLNVLIRPRGGEFCYSNLEFEIMKEDIRICKELGADGVVFGILLSDGKVDILRTKMLVELSRPMSVTFHRAFDMTPDPSKALEEIISIGIDRILTSGQKNKAIEGRELLKQLIEQADGRITIMPGSGINEQNIVEIRSFTGAKEFHLTGRKPIQSKMIYRQDGIFMGGLPEISEFEIRVTDSQLIKKLIELISG